MIHAICLMPWSRSILSKSSLKLHIWAASIADSPCGRVGPYRSKHAPGMVGRMQGILDIGGHGLKGRQANPSLTTRAECWTRVVNRQVTRAYGEWGFGHSFDSMIPHPWFRFHFSFLFHYLSSFCQSVITISSGRCRLPRMTSHIRDKIVKN